MRRASPLTAALALVAACGGPASGPDPAALPDGPILDPMAWRPAIAAEDPFEDRYADPGCSAGGYGVEGTIFEVETDLCAYLTATQPLPVDLPAGVTVETLVWHLALFATEPAQGHVALRIGEHMVFDQRVDIPGPEQVYPVTWTTPQDLPAGTQVYLHVHNHGYNSWRLGPTEVSAPP